MAVSTMVAERVEGRIKYLNCDRSCLDRRRAGHLCLGRRAFNPIFAPSMATMGQKSSLPQPALSVSCEVAPIAAAPSEDLKRLTIR
jgi:hypothetical protein